MTGKLPQGTSQVAARTVLSCRRSQVKLPYRAAQVTAKTESS